MLFKPYSEVLALESIVDLPLLFSSTWRTEWIAQEKTKGVQFSLWFSKHEIKGANRHRFLREDENYFGWKVLRDRFTPKVKEIMRRISCKEIVIYGDIIGGIYPHFSFDASSPIDRGTLYSPKNVWYVYDIVIDGMWQPQWYIYELLDEINVQMYAFELIKTSLGKILDYSQEDSEIYEFFGLPKIEGNKSAGVVLRPLQPSFFPNGKRILLKKERS